MSKRSPRNSIQQIGSDRFLLEILALPPDIDFTTQGAWIPGTLVVTGATHHQAAEGDLFEGIYYLHHVHGIPRFGVHNPEMHFRQPRVTARETARLDNPDSSVNIERRRDLDDSWRSKIGAEEVANIRYSVDCCLEGRASGMQVCTA